MEIYADKLAERFDVLFVELKKRGAVANQADMGKKIGKSDQSIRNYRLRKRMPDAEVIAMVCHKFNVNPSWILWGKGKMFSGILDNELLALWDEQVDIWEQIFLIEEMRSSLQKRKEMKTFFKKLQRKLGRLGKVEQAKAILDRFLHEYFEERLRDQHLVRFIHYVNDERRNNNQIPEDLEKLCFIYGLTEEDGDFDQENLDWLEENLNGTQNVIDSLINLDKKVIKKIVDDRSLSQDDFEFLKKYLLKEE